MSDELYKSPAFQFYADDFIADTADFTAEEVGVYMRLLCHQWKQGAIPADTNRQSLIGRVSPKQMKVIWNTLQSKYAPTEIDGYLVQPRLEKVRKEAHEYHLRRAAAGAKGGQAKAEARALRVAQESLDDLSNATAMLEQCSTNALAKGVAKGKQKGSSPVSYIDPNTSVDKSTSVLGTLASQEPEWPKALRTAVYAIGDRTIKSLTVDERNLTARYHCLVFGNCTKNENANKAKATNVAAAFASMSRSETYGALKVSQYFTAGKTLHEQREKKPWFDPWMIRAVVEFK